MKILIPVEKVLSENMYLKPRVGKSGKPYLYLPDEVRRYKKHIKEHVSQFDFSDIEPPLMVAFIFLVKKSRYYKADLSNMVKLVEDAFKEATKIDDSQHIGILSYKIPIPDNEEEAVIIVVESALRLLEDGYENPRYGNPRYGYPRYGNPHKEKTGSHKE